MQSTKKPLESSLFERLVINVSSIFFLLYIGLDEERCNEIISLQPCHSTRLFPKDFSCQADLFDDFLDMKRNDIETIKPKAITAFSEISVVIKNRRL